MIVFLAGELASDSASSSPSQTPTPSPSPGQEVSDVVKSSAKPSSLGPMFVARFKSFWPVFLYSPPPPREGMPRVWYDGQQIWVRMKITKIPI